ncbi:hypothetical protein MKX03_034810 [Papaver bracteatum]|nr:hypothetical protein MKX03_034810 [Papaver bracteatum]
MQMLLLQPTIRSIRVSPVPFSSPISSSSLPLKTLKNLSAIPLLPLSSFSSPKPLNSLSICNKKATSTYWFWGQLVCTIISVVILSFSTAITGRVSSPATFYATAGGIVATFISVFFSFGYIRLSDRLKKTASDPEKVNFSIVTLLGLNWHFFLCTHSCFFENNGMSDLIVILCHAMDLQFISEML